MKQNGFTLIELLAVIVILALLMAFVFPSVINSIKKSSEKVDEMTLELIYNATDTYISNHKNHFSKTNKNKYVISLNDLVKDGLLVAPIKSSTGIDITNSKCVQITYHNKYSYELKNTGECTELHVEFPNLYGSTLTPVAYDVKLKQWKIVSKDSDEWYDYENQEWANAVILNDGVSQEPGTIVYPDGENINIKAMYVWIPRYSYTIGNIYGVQLDGGNTPSQATPGAIDVKFIFTDTTETSIPTYEGDEPNNWFTHPAFTFGGKQIDGIWVGKFEISHSDSTKSVTSLGCVDENCINADNIRILPNVVSLRNNNTSNFFFASKSMSREGNIFKINSSLTDSHMIKNSEWTAVAYLSQSKYGKYGNKEYSGLNKEIYQNKSNAYITGSSNGTPPQEIVNIQCTYDNVNDNCGVGSSTTGNITGIYDMSGGAKEYVMGFYNGINIYQSGFKEWPNAKYFDVFTGTKENKECNGNSCYGAAYRETKEWYNQHFEVKKSVYGWFYRSGLYSENSAGIFRIGFDWGNAYDIASTHFVLTSKS